MDVIEFQLLRSRESRKMCGQLRLHSVVCSRQADGIKYADFVAQWIIASYATCKATLCRRDGQTELWTGIFNNAEAGHGPADRPGAPPGMHRGPQHRTALRSGTAAASGQRPVDISDIPGGYCQTQSKQVLRGRQ